jgi:uncharacterized membrane protein
MRLVIALAVLIAAASPARAGLSVCNKGTHAVKVALGQFNGTRWTSEGWWQVAAKKCAPLTAQRAPGMGAKVSASAQRRNSWLSDAAPVRRADMIDAAFLKSTPEIG